MKWNSVPTFELQQLLKRRDWSEKHKWKTLQQEASPKEASLKLALPRPSNERRQASHSPNASTLAFPCQRHYCDIDSEEEGVELSWKQNTRRWWSFQTPRTHTARGYCQKKSSLRSLLSFNLISISFTLAPTLTIFLFFLNSKSSAVFQSILHNHYLDRGNWILWRVITPEQPCTLRAYHKH